MARVVGRDGSNGGNLKDGAGQTLGHLGLGGFNCLRLLPKAIGVPGLLLKRGGSSPVWKRIWYERELGRLQLGSGASDARCGGREGELCVVPAGDKYHLAVTVVIH